VIVIVQGARTVFRRSCFVLTLKKPAHRTPSGMGGEWSAGPMMDSRLVEDAGKVHHSPPWAQAGHPRDKVNDAIVIDSMSCTSIRSVDDLIVNDRSLSAMYCCEVYQ